MRKKRIIKILLSVITAEIFLIVLICNYKSQAEPAPDVILRDIGPQTVLYTIHRGHYDTVNSTINKLYKLADLKGICITGPTLIGYLNDPHIQSPEHWLTEIRIPVSADAMQFTGTLGRMTDVKILPAINVAVKRERQDNPDITICSLYSWIKKRSYRIVRGLWQSILCDKPGNYAQMRTELIIPVESPTTIQG